MKGLDAMLGKPKDKGSEPAASMSEGEDCAQDLIDAIKDGDAKAADLALKRHYAVCSGEDDDDEEV